MNTIIPLSLRLEILTLTLLSWLAIYFSVNRLRVAPLRRISLAMALDKRIPFVPQLILIYFSTYIFVIQPFIILSEAGQFYWMLVNFSSITVFASLIHAIVPSKIERNEILAKDGLSGKLINLFQNICKPYGNFPSLHVALSVPVVGINFIVSGPTLGSITLIWATLIALSTLYTKQHYVLDVLAGLIAGVLICSITYFFMLA